MFIWRCTWNAVLVPAVLARQIGTIRQFFRLCSGAEETVMHSLFFCDFARAAWLASLFGLRTDKLTGDFKKTVTDAFKSLSERDFNTFVSMTWSIWRIRNEAVYGNKPQALATCQQYAGQQLKLEAKISYCNSKVRKGPLTGRLVKPGMFVFWMDPGHILGMRE